MTLYAPSITIDEVMDALGEYLNPFVSPAPVIRAQVNRVAPPPGAFVELTEVGNDDLEVSRGWYDHANLRREIIGPKRIMVQIDFYGESSGDQCAAVKTVWRSAFSTAQFPVGMAPLYCDEGHEIPLVTGEEQYLRRWALTASLQYNPVIAVPQQSAETLSMNTIQDVETMG